MSIVNRIVSILSCFAILLVLVCIRSPKDAKSDTLSISAADSADITIPTPEKSQDWNTIADVLSGVPIPDGSTYSSIVNSPAYKTHSREMNDFWQKVQTENIDKISQWAKSEMENPYRHEPVFYPLSGADFLNAISFFPEAPSYLLVALEPPGKVPDLLTLDEHKRNAGLSAIRQTIWTLAYSNYLQSKLMKKHLDNPYLTGTLPVFLIFMSRLNYDIVAVDYVSISEEGNLNRSAEKDAQGVRIRYKVGSQFKTLVYLSIRLSDAGVTSATKEGRFFLKQPNQNTIMKSAVYLLHSDRFKGVRDFVLAKSYTIVQDDSGIPYKYFEKEKWSERLYGHYTQVGHVGGIEQTPFQKDLVQAFKEKSSPLPFQYGYGILWGPNRSSLMVFTKQK